MIYSPKRAFVTLFTSLLALTGLCACSTSVSSSHGSAPTASTISAATTSSCKHSYGYMGFDVVPDNDDLALIASKHYFAEYTQYISDTENSEVSCFDVKEAYDLNDSLSLIYDTAGTLTEAHANLEGIVVDANYADGTGLEADYSASYEADRESIKDVIAANEPASDGLVFSNTIEEAVPFTNDETIYTCYVFTLDSFAVSEDETETPYTVTYKLYTDGAKLVAQYIDFGDGYALTNLYTTITGDIPEGFMTLPDTSGLEMSSLDAE